jgi:hypothetical protein
MFTRKKVIKLDNFPFRSPFQFGLVMGLTLDRLGAPGWAWGVVGCVVALGLIMFIASFWTEERVDIFKKER